MKEKIAEYQKEIRAFSSTDQQEIENFRIKFLGSKGVLKNLFADFKNVANEEKKEVGKLINDLKVEASPNPKKI